MTEKQTLGLIKRQKSRKFEIVFENGETKTVELILEDDKVYYNVDLALGLVARVYLNLSMCQLKAAS